VAALTEQEEAEILRFLGYPTWRNLALAWAISFPTGIEPQYYIRDALGRLTDAALDLARADLEQCKVIEAQLRSAIRRLKADAVGDVKLNHEEIPALRGELENWKRQLANDFGSMLNPYRLATGSSRNGQVVND
jgi:hypothetical protein